MVIVDGALLAKAMPASEPFRQVIEPQQLKISPHSSEDSIYGKCVMIIDIYQGLRTTGISHNILLGSQIHDIM